MKNLIRFKRIGSVRAPNLPSKYTKNMKKTFPLCVVMKQRNANRPGPVNPEIKQQLKPWERVHTDGTGKRKLASSTGNKYFTVFVCTHTVRKLFFPYKKRKHFHLVYMEFVAKIGRHPAVLISDKGEQLTSARFEKYLIEKGVNHITVPHNEHSSNGPVEKAIQDVNNAIKSYIADPGVPSKYWDIIGQHACLINDMVCPSPRNPDITIFEAETNSIPHFHTVPPVGCFCCRLQQKTDRVDPSLDPANQCSVFLGFVNLQSTFGSIILAEEDLVVARYNVAYDRERLPFLQKEPGLSGTSGLASNPANREIASSSGASEHQDIFFFDFFSIFFPQKT
jgi:hypothetical protein